MCRDARVSDVLRHRFDQPAKKHSRRLKRAAKAAAVAPRPVARLRPVVHCMTQKHAAKVRLGRGFSLAELKAAKISASFAKTIGIAVDHRRTNKSTDSLAANVQRLTEYKAKLVLFPKKGTKCKAGDTKDAAARAAATQLTGAIMAPTKPAAGAVEFVSVSDAMKNESAYGALRETRNNKKLAGLREKAKKEKADAKK